MRRAFVLVAVMVVTGSALLVATSLIFIARAEVTSMRGAADAAQARLLLWSGLQGIMIELDEQRDAILDAELPELERQYVIYEGPARLGVVRLLPVTPGGGRLAPEASKLDLNAVDADRLEATGWVDAALATEIVAAGRRRGGFRSVADLLAVPGVTAETLYGPLEDLTVIDDAAFEEGDVAERIETRLEGEQPRGLADLLTVYAFEPALQRSGKLRINLNVPWSEELGRRVDERFGQGASGLLKGIFDTGTKFEDDAGICRVLAATGAEAEQWPDIVDALTTEDGEFHFGRLDINTAPADALAALEGLELEQAEEIVQVRERLDADEKATIAWPLVQGIVEADRYETLAGRITTRSWTFRLRVAAGEVDADDPEGPLLRPLVAEVVVDLSAPRPRLAYLREITLLQTTALIALNAGSREHGDGEDAMAEDDSEPEPEAGADTRDMTDSDSGDGTDHETDRETDSETDSETEPDAEAGTSPSDPRKRIGRWRPG